MKHPISILFFVFNIFASNIYTQNITISGVVADANGEPLIGAVVQLQDLQMGNISNNYGFYSLTVKKGNINLQYSLVGFEKQLITINPKNDTTINVRLTTQTLTEITITETRSKLSDKVSSFTVPIEVIKKMPSLAGEPDIFKFLSLTPGVSNGTEGSAGLYVRGGTPDQNLILLDEAVVYNPNHLFGFLSVFNPDAIKNVELIKAGFPARYGGRLSSVVDVFMKEGNTQKRKTDFGIGLISSRLTIERPIIKDKMGFIFSARSSYLTVLLLPTWISYKTSTERAQYTNYYMYDVNAKLNYKIDDKNQLFLSFYTGEDNLKSLDKSYSRIEDNSQLNWGNSTATLRYNKIVSPKVFWKNMLIYSQFKYQLNLLSHALDSTGLFRDYRNTSGLNDYTFKSAIDFIPNNNHYLRFGIEMTAHQFTPQSKNYQTNDITGKNFSQKETYNAFEPALFVEDDWSIGKHLKANIGLRIDNYRLDVKKYYSVEPRIALNYKLNNSWVLKSAYSEMQQNIHLLTNSSIGFQNDIWVPSTDSVRPQRSKQWVVGMSKYFQNLDLDFSVEAYYKKMSYLIDFKEGANIVTSLEKWQKSVENNGTGWSKGLELFLHKKTGKFNGFVSYTLSKTDRMFNNINFGKKYPFRYDNRHNLSISGNYPINKKWDFSFTWTYKTGDAITLPIAVFSIPTYINVYTNQAPIYTNRNSYRLPNYHRGDIAFNKTTITQKGRKKVWNFSIYNVYNRANILYVEIVSTIGYDRINKKSTNNYVQELRARSLLPIIPSFSYALSF